MYPIEVRIASKNGWFTPAEARAYYGKYNRTGVTVHWWDGGEGANMHDTIVNVLLNGAAAGTKSANYVVSDDKITMLVHPDDVAFASTSGNPTTISIEHQPTLGAEGYKKSGWLIHQLELRYGVDMHLYPHSFWNSTECPGTISIDRLVQEANKWATGAYDPAPAPAPAPTPTPAPAPVEANVTFAAITPATYVANKQPTNLYQVNKAAWADIGVVKTFAQGEKIDIVGVVKNPTLGVEWYVTKYSFDNKLPNGFSKADLDLFVAPAPTPAPTVEPQYTALPKPVTMYTLANAKLVDMKTLAVIKTFALDEPIEVAATATYNGKAFYATSYGFDRKSGQGFLTGDLKDAVTPAPAPVPEQPEWVKNLQDMDDTEYWFSKEQALIDITTGKPATGNSAKSFAVNDSFVSSARTIANGKEYRITDYSFKKGIFNGVPIDSLTLTAPGLPDIPPVVHDPNLINKNVVIAFLESLVKIITDFLAKVKS